MAFKASTWYIKKIIILCVFIHRQTQDEKGEVFLIIMKKKKL